MQAQTNRLTSGLGANWTVVTGSAITNQMWFPIAPQNPAVFFRLAKPSP